jgi:hypothetical protein
MVLMSFKAHKNGVTKYIHDTYAPHFISPLYGPLH